MLAIIAIISVLVLDAVRGASSAGIRIQRVSREAVTTYLDLQSVRGAVRNSAATYADSPHAFRGDATGFAGLTYPVLRGIRSGPAPYSMSLIRQGTTIELIYTEGTERWSVARWSDVGAHSFAFADSTAALTWHERWPPDTGLLDERGSHRTYFTPPPRAARLSLQTSPEPTILIFEITGSAPPPPRIEDLLQESGIP